MTIQQIKILFEFICAMGQCAFCDNGAFMALMGLWGYWSMAANGIHGAYLAIGLWAKPATQCNPKVSLLARFKQL